MNKKVIFICLILIIGCKTDESTIAKVNLDFLKTYTPNINNGKKIFNYSCITCHLYGSAGAATLTDKKYWSQLLNKKSNEDIYLNVLNGFMGKKGPMPEKGACINCSDNDLIDAIEYILSINGLTIKNQKINMDNNQ